MFKQFLFIAVISFSVALSAWGSSSDVPRVTQESVQELQTETLREGIRVHKEDLEEAKEDFFEDRNEANYYIAQDIFEQLQLYENELRRRQ